MSNETPGLAVYNFSDALALLKDGERVARKSWNGPGQYITLQRPDAHSKMTKPYAYITTAQGDRIPWVPSQTDMLADDWYVL